MSGGVFVFGYLQFQLQYLLLPWYSVQRVHIGYIRSALYTIIVAQMT